MRHIIEPDVVSDAPYDKQFYAKDGKIIKNIKELLKTIGGMNEETFKHHVNENKNDFVKWIGLVMKDYYLADKLEKVKDKKTTIKIIKKRLKEINKHANVRNIKEKPIKFFKQNKIKKPKEIKISKIKKEAADSPNFIKNLLKGLLIGAVISILIWCVYIIIIYSNIT